MLVLGVLIILIYNFFSYAILNTFFDESFLKINYSLKLFSWAPLMIFMGMIYEKHLITTNRIEKNVYRFILGCISNLIFSIILIPKYAINGAIIAVLVSHFLTNIAFVIFDAKSRKELKFLFLK
jgi:O-antigen/teichoic acid export membrane protein